MAKRTAAGLALLLVLGGLVGCSDDGASDDEATESPEGPEAHEADCAPARPLEPTDEPLTFTSGGQERSYLLALPEGYDGTTAQPLLFAFHGHGGSKEVARAASGFDTSATARGYVVVFADALGEPRAWNFTGGDGPVDDFAFVNGLVADLSDRLCIDPERVFAAGHSNGSAFTGFLSCKEPYPWAAVAMVSAFIPSTCTEGVPLPSVLAVHGTADPGVPYEGGLVAGGPASIGPALGTLDSYRDAYGCDPTPVEDELQPGVERKLYTGCADSTEVALYSVVGGDHEWPQDPFSASEAILDFFDEHPRAGAAGGAAG